MNEKELGTIQLCDLLALNKMKDCTGHFNVVVPFYVIERFRTEHEAVIRERDELLKKVVELTPPATEPLSEVEPKEAPPHQDFHYEACRVCKERMLASKGGFMVAGHFVCDNCADRLGIPTFKCPRCSASNE